MPARFLIYLLFMTGMSQTEANAAPAPRPRSRNVLVLGDSLSAGFRLQARDAWPALVEKRLREIDPSFHVINASVSGSTSEGGLRRLASYLREPIDLLVLELGINDAFRGVPVAQIRENLQSAIDRVRDKNPSAMIIVVGMQFPIVTDDAYVTAFGAMFGQLAAQNHAVLVPYLLEGVAGDPTLNLDDRIHPNAAGHRILAETMWRALEPVARQMGSSRPEASPIQRAH